jgi:hypothetical protein
VKNSHYLSEAIKSVTTLRMSESKGSWITSVRSLPDLEELAVGLMHGEVVLVDLEKQVVKQTFKGHKVIGLPTELIYES